MDKKNEHIDQLTPEVIKAYHAGKLSPEQMHQVEVLMLENPLFGEGMEGLESIDPEALQNDLSALDSLLDKKVNHERVGFWNIYTRAAAIVILLVSSIGLFYLTNTSEVPTKELGQLKNEQEEAPKDSAALEKKPSAPLESRPDSSQSKPDAALSKPSKPVFDKMVADAKPVESLKSMEDDKPTEELLRGKVAGLKVTPSQAQITQPSKLKAEESKRAITERDESLDREIVLRESRASAKLKVSDLTTNFSPQNSIVAINGLSIRGTIKGADDSLALPQVSIFVKGTQQGTSSSEDGKYELNNLLKGSKIVFRYIGYQTKEIQVDSSGTLDVSLEIDNTSLGEVVVISQGLARERKALGYSIEQPNEKKRNRKATKAEPAIGFKAFDKYLKTNLQYPATAKAEKVRGRVTLEFDVSATGELSNFKIVKGLGYGCDEEAIRLVKEGPLWNPRREGANKTPLRSTVKIKVRFRP